MWKKYLALGAAVWILSGVSMVSHASETVSSGEPEQIETEVQGQGAETSEIPVMAQAEVSAQSAAGTYATSRTCVPYEGAKYSLTYEVRENGVVITGITGYESKDDLGELVIPGEIDGVNVTEIGNEAFYCCSGLTGNLIIPEGGDDNRRLCVFRLQWFNRKIGHSRRSDDHRR